MKRLSVQNAGSRQWRFSLRAVMFGTLIVATTLSGALGNVFSIVLTAVGLALAGATFYSQRTNAWLSLAAGLGYVAVAAVVARLMQLR